MTETLLFFVAVLAASIVVMWCERIRLERQIVSLLSDLASERSTVSRQIIELAEVKADAIQTGEQFATMQAEMRAACLQVTKERDQIKMDLDYAQECYWGEAETAYHLRCSRAVIIDHCRKLKRANGHDRFAHKIEIDCANGKVEEMKKERDHARKLMDETRERCGAEIDVCENTIRDLQHYKTLAESRAKQIVSENEYWCTVNDQLRQSRQKIIDHCRKLKRELANEKRAAEHLSSECYTLTKQHDAAIAERDHARKLMDENREHCGDEIDAYEDTIRDLQREKSMSEVRAKQVMAENKHWCTVNDQLRQSMQKIIEHCRKINRDQKKFIRMTDYILDELTTINTSR